MIDVVYIGVALHTGGVDLLHILAGVVLPLFMHAVGLIAQRLGLHGIFGHIIQVFPRAVGCGKVKPRIGFRQINMG